MKYINDNKNYSFDDKIESLNRHSTVIVILFLIICLNLNKITNSTLYCNEESNKLISINKNYLETACLYKPVYVLESITSNNDS